ncbi:MAG TPA: DUF222 domain-containing protein [Propionibacteriaceae bacterium]|nr:DUF222 domain-containing protein [Propionibacteriaceae bacterium]
MLEALQRIRIEAVECAETPAWSLTDADVEGCLDVVQQGMQALSAVLLHLIHQVDTRGIPATQRTPQTAMWLRERLRMTPTAARRLVRLAKAVDERPGLDQALGAAAVNVEQATAVVDAVEALPSDTGVEVAAKAEAMLLEWAGQFDARQLGVLGRRVLAHVAPEVAEAAEGKAVERDNASAYAARTLSIVPQGDGRVRLSGWLDTEAAAVVSAALEPLCSPRRHVDVGQSPIPDAAGSGTAGSGTAGSGAGAAAEGAGDRAVSDERTFGQRRVDALVEVCRLALNTGQLPDNGGDRPQLTVTVDVNALRAQVGVATLDTGDRLTAAQARRLACDAHLLPAVLDTQGQVLDVGRSRRLVTGAVRRALVLRDRGCAFPSCDRPPRWTEGHHITSWADGGTTSLDNSVLLCGYHHRVIHHTAWHVRLAHDMRPEFIPPVHVDPEQRPRRNLYHRRT